LVLLRIHEALIPGGTLRLALLKEIPEDENLRQEWDALVEGVDQPQVFYTYEWALAVQRTYGAALRPLLFLLRDKGDCLRGIAALATSPEAEQASFLCATTGDYCDFLSLPEHREALVAAVMRELRRQNIGEIRLANLPADSATVPALRHAARSQGYHCFSRTAYICAQVSLRALQRRGENKPVLPRKKMLRRFLNAMGREAPVRLEHTRSWEQAEAVLPGFIEAHIARFLATGRISNLASKERQLFLAQLAKLLSERGWFALTTFAAGQRIFAWNYGFQFRSTWFWYQPTFDSDFEKYSPGFCLLAKLIEEAADKPELQTVDLGLGAEDYKERFANRTRETLYVTLTSSGTAHLREVARYRAATIVKLQPQVEVAARSITEQWRRLREGFAGKTISQVFAKTVRRVQQLLWLETEVKFYKVSAGNCPNSGEMILPLDLPQLARAASAYMEDGQTLAYLLRSAARLRSGGASGFVMVDHNGTPLHFVWVAAFDGFFLSELNAPVNGPSPKAVMLFDCWTPLAVRGRGHYAQAVGLVARKARAEGKEPWIFSAATNCASVRALEKAGFGWQYSLTRRRILWWERITKPPRSESNAAAEEISASV
jgi:CelD/BcsL family acetyltransferase involved in cellulose biosynthesis